MAGYPNDFTKRVQEYAEKNGMSKYEARQEILANDLRERIHDSADLDDLKWRLIEITHWIQDHRL